MKLALYRLAEYPKSDGSVYEATEYKEKDPAWVRLSEIVEVDFPHRDLNEIIQQSVAGIDNEIAKEVRDHLQRLSDLKQTKAELLALVHQPDPVCQNYHDNPDLPGFCSNCHHARDAHGIQPVNVESDIPF